ncbi:hypothetical protein HII31_11422 [Pseudocercospora fuligena]|uniref:Myb-like domain-containing protein n=1 Tax=Pseudocercospora fuligena TaxID=685502 RepID=A0A8H6VGL3_9PEZI|nr:hypothetical protein HII31_11422 [Pseudocercospora fuligena]
MSAEKATHRPESFQPKGGRGGPGTPWSAEDLQTLKQLYEKGMERQDIAKQLGRSRNSVNAKITYARESQRWHRVVHKWDENQKKRLLELRDEGKTFREIGRILGRNGEGVRNKFRELRPGLSVRKWTDEDHEIASKLHSKGYTVYQIGREMNRHPSTVEYYVLDNQYQRHHSAKPWTPEEEFKMYKMHEAGFSPHEIADKLGRSRQIIWTRLTPRSSGVIRRFTPSEDAKLKELRESGKKWEEVRDLMPDRTILQLRGRWSLMNGSRKRRSR